MKRKKSYFILTKIRNKQSKLLKLWVNEPVSLVFVVLCYFQWIMFYLVLDRVLWAFLFTIIDLG